MVVKKMREFNIDYDKIDIDLIKGEIKLKNKHEGSETLILIDDKFVFDN